MLPLNQTVDQIIKKIQTPGSPEHGDPATLHLLLTIQHCLETPQQQGLDTAFDLLSCSDMHREPFLGNACSPSLSNSFFQRLNKVGSTLRLRAANKIICLTLLWKKTHAPGTSVCEKTHRSLK